MPLSADTKPCSMEQWTVFDQYGNQEVKRKPSVKFILLGYWNTSIPCSPLSLGQDYTLYLRLLLDFYEIDTFILQMWGHHLELFTSFVHTCCDSHGQVT